MIVRLSHDGIARAGSRDRNPSMIPFSPTPDSENRFMPVCSPIAAARLPVRQTSAAAAIPNNSVTAT